MTEGRTGVRRTKELVKLRLMTGETAALRAAAMAERWRNIVCSIDDVVVLGVVRFSPAWEMEIELPRKPLART